MMMSLSSSPSTKGTAASSGQDNNQKRDQTEREKVTGDRKRRNDLTNKPIELIIKMIVQYK